MASPVGPTQQRGIGVESVVESGPSPYRFCVIFCRLVLSIDNLAGKHRAKSGSALAKPWLDEHAATGDS
jgi:hypothetical protein